MRYRLLIAALSLILLYRENHVPDSVKNSMLSLFYSLRSIVRRPSLSNIKQAAIFG